MLVVPSDTQLRPLASHGDEVVVDSNKVINRRVRSDKAAFHQMFESGYSAASDASGTLLIFDGGSVVLDASKHRSHIVSAAAVGSTF